MGIKYPYGLHRGYFCPLIGLFFTHIKEASFPLFGYFVLSYFSGLFTLIPFIHRLFRAFLYYYYFRYFVLLPIYILSFCQNFISRFCQIFVRTGYVRRGHTWRRRRVRGSIYQGRQRLCFCLWSLVGFRFFLVCR